jgi:hypothetical protein
MVVGSGLDEQAYVEMVSSFFRWKFSSLLDEVTELRLASFELASFVIGSYPIGDFVFGLYMRQHLFTCPNSLRTHHFC